VAKAANRRPALLSPFALARRNAIYKGVFEGDRKWLAIGGAAWGVRLLRKSLGKNEQVVALEKLEPGQGVILRTIPPVKRRELKRAKKRARSQARLERKADKVAKQAAKSAKKASRQAARQAARAA
jgi:hypothetical protein